MKRFLLALPLLLLSHSAGHAEDPLMLGLRSALQQFEGVPEESSRPAKAAAIELLGRYMKKHEENQLLQYGKNMENRFLNELFSINHLPLLRIPVSRFYDPEHLKSRLVEAGVSIC